jgi:hypothetical protein
MMGGDMGVERLYCWGALMQKNEGGKLTSCIVLGYSRGPFSQDNVYGVAFQRAKKAKPELDVADLQVLLVPENDLPSRES